MAFATEDVHRYGESSANGSRKKSYDPFGEIHRISTSAIFHQIKKLKGYLATALIDSNWTFFGFTKYGIPSFWDRQI